MGPGYRFGNVAGDFIDDMQQAIDWIELNYPQDADGWLRHQKISGGAVNTRGWDATETADLSAILENVIVKLP